jgi:hypothetical protein
MCLSARTLELQRVFSRFKEMTMFFFTQGDVIFRLWLCHPG